MTRHDIPIKFRERASSAEGLRSICCREGYNISKRTAERLWAEEKARRAIKPSLDSCDEIIEKLEQGPVVTISSPEKARGSLLGRRYVFTAAQNDTPIHEEFFASLLMYCSVNDAHLVVGGIRYGGDADAYANQVRPYMVNKSMELGLASPGLLWCGEIQLNPTMVDPLSALDSYTVGNSGIFPHTKVRMKSLPHMRGDSPRFHYTTGCCTLRNYKQNKAAHKASFHHVYGALVVEIDPDGVWFARQLIADDSGVFYDLDREYNPTSWREGVRVTALNLGDCHFPNHSEALLEWARDMSDVLKPKMVFLHDVYDFHAKNHHNKGDVLHDQVVYPGSVAEEYKQCMLMLHFMAEIMSESALVVVHSNHNMAFDKWLKTADWKSDPVNARFYIEAWARLFALGAVSAGYDGDFFCTLMQDLFKDIKFLRKDESFELFSDRNKPIECGIHGHTGINGSIGSPTQFTKIGKRANTGHTHTAGILDGVYTAGTSTPLELGYNSGLSTWSNSHIVTYPNGKRTIITCVGERWKGENLW